MQPTRVVITGMGVISPCGLDTTSLWNNLIAGRSGIGLITSFDTSEFEVRLAGEVWGFDPLDYLPAKEARRTDRFTQYALAALEQAIAQSRLIVTEADAYQIGVLVGSGVGGIRTYTQELDGLRQNGPRRVNPFLIPSITVDVPSVQIALRTGARGPNFGLASACATGADAIGQAYETIRRGHARAMITGGVEAAVTPIGVAAFDRMRALSHRNDDPSAASRPFDAGRDGFVISDGGAILVLEDLDFALQRGAQPLAELVSYASTSDAVHLAAPEAGGAGSARCMELALERAGLRPEEISYINAHGTSTPSGDLAETLAIKQIFGEHAYRVPISSTKSMTGHLLGGAGALESVICVLALQQDLLPPTINQTQPDPDCDLDYVPNQARPARLETALTNSFGFGGHNTTLILSSFIDR
jgi:3-oxoacyl-[acyl-carrier-protein] synthase II